MIIFIIYHYYPLLKNMRIQEDLRVPEIWRNFLAKKVGETLARFRHFKTKKENLRSSSYRLTFNFARPSETLNLFPCTMESLSFWSSQTTEPSNTAIPHYTQPYWAAALMAARLLMANLPIICSLTTKITLSVETCKKSDFWEGILWKSV